MPRHTHLAFESELSTLRENLLLMGARVERMIVDSARALEIRDGELALATMKLDAEVNRLEVETDELCVRVLAKRQPVAADLRFITSALKLVTDLERMGDLCGNICEHVVELALVPTVPELERMPVLAEHARQLVKDALDAFVHADAERARAVVDRDRLLDAEYAALSGELREAMKRGGDTVLTYLRAQAVARALERIGDHATNVAERVVYLVSGVDIRHMGRKRDATVRTPRGVLFVCADNAAASQMAEGWARRLFRAGVRVFSAGTSPAAAVRPAAVSAMKEIGIDITRQSTKRLADVPWESIDLVVRLSAERLPQNAAGGQRVETWELPSPRVSAEDDDDAYRALRDEIGLRVRGLAADG